MGFTGDKMAQRVRKITPAELKKIIVQEARKLQKEAAQENAKRPEDVDADETDADEYADTLANKIDYLKALKIHEARALSNLKKIREAQGKIKRAITKS